MTTAIRRAGTREKTRVTSDHSTRREVKRRLAHVLGQLAEARTRLHQTQAATQAAEEAWLWRRQERERAAERVAELAELAESLQGSLLE
jgi:hypothetical protein